MPTLNKLKSVRCRNLLKHAKDEKSSGVAGKLFQLCITRFEKKYLQASVRDCCTKSSSCVRVLQYLHYLLQKEQIRLHRPYQTVTCRPTHESDQKRMRRSSRLSGHFKFN